MIIDRNIATQPAAAIPDFDSLEEQGTEEGYEASSNADDIARRAYFYWQERGCPDGSADEDWFRAENDLVP